LLTFDCFDWIDSRKALRHLLHLLHRHGELGLYFIANAPVFSVYEAMGQNPQWAPYLQVCSTTTNHNPIHINFDFSDPQDVGRFIPKTHFSDDPTRDVRQLLTSVGYQVQEVTALTRSFTFESLEAMIGGSSGVTSVINLCRKGM